MGVSTYLNDTPRCTSEDYRTRYDEPCVFDGGGDGNYDWYRGTGISIKEHPLSDKVWPGNCGHCKSEDVLVIAAQWNVHPFSGDEYWDCEVACEECGKYTHYSYVDSDD